MPYWPFSRRQPLYPHVVIASSTHKLEVHAAEAFYAKQWEESKRLYREIIATSDPEGRQVARNMLGRILEKQKREAEAIPLYEQNVAEGCPFPHAHVRLAIIYHRLGQLDDERRVILAGIQVTESNRSREWFQDRLKKMK